MRVLHILTGEYPPQPGGVGDYCALVAAGVAAEGRGVHVWCPGHDARRTEASGIFQGLLCMCESCLHIKP